MRLEEVEGIIHDVHNLCITNAPLVAILLEESPPSL